MKQIKAIRITSMCGHKVDKNKMVTHSYIKMKNFTTSGMIHLLLQTQKESSSIVTFLI